MASDLTVLLAENPSRLRAEAKPSFATGSTEAGR
jgi:hypothetical protein